MELTLSNPGIPNPMVYTGSFSAGCDHMIWNAFQKGNKEAFATLYNRYAELLKESSMRISNEKDMVEDCIHEFFLNIWKNKMNLAAPQSVKAYLVSSVHRMVIRELKKRRTWQHMFRDVVFPKVTPSVEEQIITDQTKSERQKKVRNSLSALTKRQQEAVYLKFYANNSYPQIAEKMSITTDSVYNLVSKAIENIERELGKTSAHTFCINHKKTA
jgi:RNA polymerase sigma factor (sigma-70 family)